MNKKMIKDTLILTVITLIAGLLLAMVYYVTKNPIADAQAKAKEKAYKSVFENADTFEEDTKHFVKEASDILKKGKISASSINEVMIAKDKDGEELGYVMSISNEEGYGGTLTFSMGIQKDGTVNGIEFLTLNETAGLGMKAKEPEFKKQYEGRKVESFQYTKTGAAKDNEIDAISGATITTNAVTNGVNAGIYYFEQITGGDNNE